VEWRGWAEFALVVLLALYIWRGRWPPLAPVRSVPLDPSKAYGVYCRDFDIEVEVKDLVSTLGLPRVSSEELLATIENGLGAWRERHDFAALESAARIRSATSQQLLEDTVVSLLIDHSGSMRGQRMLLAAGAVRMASGLLDSLKVKHEVLGFTTVRWKGGLSREKWLRSGRPPYPGRLNDILHIIYSSAVERLSMHHCATMLHPELLKENLDGEAIQWAASRLRKRAENRKSIIVVSDGAPVDDSTLRENGGEYLENDLLGVIQEIMQDGDIQLSAIGINFSVERYYQRSVVVTSPDDLGTAILRLLEQLLCKPRANA
jgi:cobaltochelatase CobT